jgi:hypothetical protein
MDPVRILRARTGTRTGRKAARGTGGARRAPPSAVGATETVAFAIANGLLGERGRREGLLCWEKAGGRAVDEIPTNWESAICKRRMDEEGR